MSNISPDFIYSVGSLYEEINVHNKDFLNENSEYYDAEMSYLVEDIFSTISTSMIYGGYSASAVIGFLADSSSQSILEKYLTFDENILSERVIDEDYILEQFGIFDYCIDEGLGTLLGKVTKGAVGLAGRIASKPARMRILLIQKEQENYFKQLHKEQQETQMLVDIVQHNPQLVPETYPLNNLQNYLQRQKLDKLLKR